MNPVLSARGVEKSFGAVVAAAAIDIDVPAGQTISLIGSNGAGKTTFINMVTGYLRPDRGTIALDGIALNIQEPMDLTMTCDAAQSPYSATVLDPRIVAVKVGATVEK